MYKIETHLHTSHVSRCGQLNAAQIASAYKEAGYSAVIVTDHYSRITFDHLKINLYDDSDKLSPFLAGYRYLLEEGAKVGLEVYRGAEVRFDECDNDYLVYGYHENLLADPAKVFAMGIAEFSKTARQAGALIIQAHPYRKGCTPAFACYIDGVEVDNRNPRHDSHNDWARNYADEYGLIATCGSDCHRTTDIGLGGILIDAMPKNHIGMARLIRYRKFQNL